MIPSRILGTGSAVAGRRVSTTEIAERAWPHRDPAEAVRKTGIDTRHWLGPRDTASGLAASALREALAASGLAAADLRRIVLVTSTGGDHRIPATVNRLAAALDLDDTCDGFDLNNSCAGFLSGLDVAARSVATGLGPVAVVAVETFSRLIAPSEPRAYLILGDAAAAVVLGPGRPGEGIVASRLRTTAAMREHMQHPLPGDPEGKPIVFDAPSDALARNAASCIRRSAEAVLAEAGLSRQDIAWFLPHQPNGRMLEAIADAAGFPADKLVPVVREIGSVGSAAVPASLDRLMRTRPVRPGDHILMASVGAGTAYGAILYRVAP